MSKSIVRLTGTALTMLLLLIAAGSWHSIGAALQAQPKEPKGSKLKELLQERLAAFKEIAAETVKAYKGGSVSFDQVQHANEAVLKAELDLCETNAQRIEVLEKIVSLAKEQEKYAVKMHQARQAAATVPLKARVGRLEAEIALERAREK